MRDGLLYLVSSQSFQMNYLERTTKKKSWNNLLLNVDKSVRFVTDSSSCFYSM